jgi:PAS domain S-box-containing protein
MPASTGREWSDELMERLPGLAFVIAIGEGIPHYVSPQVETMLGITPEEWAHPDVWRSLIHPDDFERVQLHFGSPARREPFDPIEYRLVTKDGRVVWVRVVASMRRDAAGRAIALEGVAFDLTELIEARERLRRSEERFRLLVLEASEVVAIADAEGNATWVSPSISRITGLDAETYTGKSGFAFVHPDDVGPAKAAMRRAVLSRQSSGAPILVRAAHADGSYRFLETWSVNLVDEPAVGGIVVSARDVTEDVRLRSELAETKDFLEHLVQASPVGIVAGQANGMVTEYVSPNVERLLGATPAAPPNATEWLMERTHPDDRESLAALIERANQAGAPTVQMTTRLRHADGDYRWFEVVTHFRYGETGRPATFVGYFVDITERVRADERRALLEGQLHESRRLEALGQLAGGIAHDFNNRLAAMLTFADLALREPDQDAMREHVAEIKTAAERASTLTRQLLVFARRQVVLPRPLDVGEVIESMHTLLARTLGEHIELQIDRPEGLWSVNADPGQIEQIVLDLSVNARDAVRSSGRIEISTHNALLDEAYVRRHPGATTGPHVRLRVSDNGIGMTSDVAARALEPFFTTKPVGQGTGLGLAAVYGIVTQGGGHLVIDSAPGSGTTIDLLFPAAVQGDDPVDPRLAGEPGRGRGETILVAEDEDQLRTALCAALATNGYRTLEARTGEEALRLARDHQGPIHLLLADVVMPAMSGRDLAERMRTERPGATVLLMSGYPNQAAPAVRAETFIAKPFSTEVLLRRVRAALGVRV